MKAMRLVSSASGLHLSPVELPKPRPAAGELLIQVRAAGVTPTELAWYPTTHTRSGDARQGAVPGHEFSGVVVDVGGGAATFAAGQEVFGMNDWFADGATAEFCLTQPSNVALKPAALSHAEAATVPIGALTAWQGLLDRAGLQPKERVLIHGGSGAVGHFAVQLAHRHGAHVISTASEDSLSFVRQLGADEVIDYRTGSFGELARTLDVVFDTVGGSTRDRSWPLLKAGGRLITIAADAEGHSDERIKSAFFIVEPNGKQLAEVAGLLESGELRTFIKAEVALGEAPSAYAGAPGRGSGHGKVVIAVGK